MSTDPVRLACLKLIEVFENAWVSSGLCAEVQRAKRATAGVAAPKFEPEEYEGLGQPRKTTSHRSGEQQGVPGQVPRRGQVRGGGCVGWLVGGDGVPRTMHALASAAHIAIVWKQEMHATSVKRPSTQYMHIVPLQDGLNRLASHEVSSYREEEVTQNERPIPEEIMQFVAEQLMEMGGDNVQGEAHLVWAGSCGCGCFWGGGRRGGEGIMLMQSRDDRQRQRAG